MWRNEDRAGALGDTLAVRRWVVIVGAGLLVAACTTFNDMYDSIFEDEEEVAAEDVPGEDQPFPNLATVPPPPEETETSVNPEGLAEGLIADRDRARYADQVVRERSIDEGPLAVRTTVPETQQTADTGGVTARLAAPESEDSAATTAAAPEPEPVEISEPEVVPEPAAAPEPVATAEAVAVVQPVPEPVEPAEPAPSEDSESFFSLVGPDPSGESVVVAETPAAPEPIPAPAAGAEQAETAQVIAAASAAPAPAATATTDRATSLAPVLRRRAEGDEASASRPAGTGDIFEQAFSAAEVQADPSATVPPPIPVPTQQTGTTTQTAAIPQPAGSPSDVVAQVVQPPTAISSVSDLGAAQQQPAPQLAAIEDLNVPGTIVISSASHGTTDAPVAAAQAASAAPAQQQAFQQQAALPFSEVPSVPVQPFAVGLSPGAVKVGTIGFHHGSSRLSPAAVQVLRQITALQQQNGGTVRVVGHASSRTREMSYQAHQLTNLRQSTERANVVATELIRLGVNPQRIVVDAVADSQPIYYESMPSGEAGNRRAEIYIDN